MVTAALAHTGSLINRAVCLVVGYLRKLKGSVRGMRSVAGHRSALPLAGLLAASLGPIGGGAYAQDTLPVVSAKVLLGPGVQSAFANIPASGRFGRSCVGMGDIDGNGVPDIAVSTTAETGLTGNGAVYLCLLGTGGTVNTVNRIVPGAHGFTATLANNDGFGGRVANLGDIDNNGVNDMAVSAGGDDHGGTDRGAIYILRLTASGTVLAHQKIASAPTNGQPLGGFTGSTANGHALSGALAGIGDQDGDGVEDLVVGTYQGNDGGAARGGVYILLLNTNGTVKSHYRISGNTGWNGNNPLSNGDEFGIAAAPLGDLNGDGIRDLAISTRLEDEHGAIHICFMNSAGGVGGHQKIGRWTHGGLQTVFSSFAGFGFSLAPMGDLNADGVVDLLAGVRLHDDDFTDDGAAIILYLDTSGTVQYEELISEDFGADAPNYFGLHTNAQLGFSVACLGDINNDAVTDIAIGANTFNTGSGGGNVERGRVWMLSLRPKPIVVSSTTVSRTETRYGSAELVIKGGVRPYRTCWGRDFPSPPEFAEWKNTVASMDWSQDGFTELPAQGLTWDGLRTITAPRTDSMEVGRYPVTVFDARDSAGAHEVIIGRTILADSLWGAAWNADLGSLTKTNGTNAWTTAGLRSSNRTRREQDNGWLRFQPGTASGELAVGLTEPGASRSSSYTHMACAIVLEGGLLKYRFGQQLVSTGLAVNPRDEYAIELSGPQVRMKRNGVQFAIGTLDATKEYQLDCVIKTTGAHISGLKAAWYPQSSTNIVVYGVVTHIECDGTPGQINAYHQASILGLQVSYVWTGPNGGLHGAPGAITEPGTYTLLVAGVLNGVTHQGEAVFHVGYKVEWVEKENASTIWGSNTLSVFPNTGQGLAAATNGPATAQLEENWIERTIPVLDPLMCDGGTLYHDRIVLQDLVSGTTAQRLIVFPVNPYILVAVAQCSAGQVIGLVGQGHRIHLEWDVNGVRRLDDLDLSNITYPPPVGVACQVPATPDHIRLRGRLPCSVATLYNVAASFGCGPLPRALLEHEPVDGYHRAEGGRIEIAYKEDYSAAGSSLHYTISPLQGAQAGEPVISEATVEVPLDHRPGYNELTIPLTLNGEELAEGFYWLEVTNEKGIKQYLRFKYEH